MGGGGIYVRLVDNGLSQRLLRKEVAAKRAMRTTMGELRRRAPAKVAKAVAGVYAIKQADVKPGGSGMGGRGSLSMGGADVGSFTMVYTGSPMTPTHFRMSPASPPGGRRYTIKATIMKGSRVTIGHWAPRGSEGGAYARPGASPYFLAHGNGGTALPFQRHGNSLDKVFRTVSIPQMVGNDRVLEEAMSSINELAESRLTHNLERYLNAS